MESAVDLSSATSSRRWENGPCDAAVQRWKTIAVALHRGDLDECDPFETTQDVIEYLSLGQDRAACSTLNVHQTLTSPKRKDFYYHPDKLAGPVGLSKFFSNHHCVLCQDVRVCLSAEGNFAFIRTNHIGASYPEDLGRLQHLAVMHTPYFVMLFSNLAESKTCVFYESPDERYQLARCTFESVKHEQSSTFADLGNPIDFLKRWWTFQDIRGVRILKVSIPWYFHLTTGTVTTWNPRSDTFAQREPQPMFTFLERHCLYHEMWRQEPRGGPFDVSTRVKTLTEGRFAVSSWSVLIPKLHVEDVLQSAMEVCKDRREALLEESRLGSASRRMDCSSSLEPRLDCLVLEDTYNQNAVMLHVVTTLDVQWQSLNVWLSGVHSNLDIYKVLIGVMGSLRDICLMDKRPPRRLYTAREGPMHALATAFFVHRDTGEVLSLLPFASLPRTYRSSNKPEDEDAFRNACARLVLCVFYAGESNAQMKLEEMDTWWKTEDPVTSGFWEAHVNPGGKNAKVANVVRLCKTGMVDKESWANLRPHEAGLRDVINLDAPKVWLGKTSRSPETLKHRLLELGLGVPESFSVIIELLGEDADRVRRLVNVDTTRTYQGLVNLAYPVVTQRLDTTAHRSKVDCSRWPGGGVEREQNATKRLNESTLSEVANKKVLPEGDPGSSSSSSKSFSQFGSWTPGFSSFSHFSSSGSQFDNPYSLKSGTYTVGDEEWLPILHALFANSYVDKTEFNKAVRCGTQNNGTQFSPLREPSRCTESDENYHCDSSHSGEEPEHGEQVEHAEGEVRPGAVTERVTVEVRGGRDEKPRYDELEKAKRAKRWKSIGYTKSLIKELGITEYHPVKYVRAGHPLHKLLDTKLHNVPVFNTPLKFPCTALPSPPLHENGWVVPTKRTPPAEGVIRIGGNNKVSNWRIGVESRENCSSDIMLVPKDLSYKRRIPHKTLTSKTEPIRYCLIDLGRPLGEGEAFEHVELIINELPTLVRDETRGLLTVKSLEPFYLGSICTIHDVAGLLIHKVRADNLEGLRTILDMHTSLQVHPFVPRTFTLQLTTKPGTKDGVGLFVGESAGDWNLGHGAGMHNISPFDEYTLAYHVMQCLVRAQILSVRVLGFPLKCIQPARIWHSGTAFRLDFIGCLVDALDTQRKCTASGARMGLIAINETMAKLDLVQRLPEPVRDMLTAYIDDSGQGSSEDEYILHHVYNLCRFVANETSAESDWNAILGPGEYQQVTLQTLGAELQPYGPFYIQIHNQCIKWNTSIMVQSTNPQMAQVLNRYTVPIRIHAEHKPRRKTGTRTSTKNGTTGKQRRKTSTGAILYPKQESAPVLTGENSAYYTQSHGGWDS